MARVHVSRGESLLEREAEQAELERRLVSLREGEGGAVLLEGPPGIGKTALMNAVLAVDGCEGLTLLRAQGSELEGALTFGGVRQLLGETVLRLEQTIRDDLLTGPAALAGPVLGVASQSLVDPRLVDPLNGLYWLVVGLAERGPLVLAIDDLHWLDVESARFVAYLLARLEGVPALVLATARSPEPGIDDVVTTAQAAFKDVIHPAPLSRAAVRSLIADRLDDDVHTLTGGNPLFAIELGLSLSLAPADTPLDELGSPTVARLVLDRVKKVSPQAIELANTIALFPNGADLDDAAAVAELDTEAAATAADALIRVQVLAPQERLVFVHPIMRSAIYDQLGAFARRRGHAAVVKRLKEFGAPAEAIAAHLLATPPVGDPDNVSILRAAADAAITAVAPRAAVRYLERALAEDVATGEDLRTLLLELGRLQHLISHPHAQQTLTRAFDASEAGQRAEAAIELAAAAFAAADYAAVESIVAETQDLEASGDERLALDMLLAEALWLLGKWRACFEVIDAVPTDLRGETAAERCALVQSASVRVMRGAPIEEARDLLLRAVGERGAGALVAGVDIGDPIGWLIQCEAFDEARAFAEQRLQYARETGNEALFGSIQAHLGWMASVHGDLVAAEAAFRLGLAAPGLGAHYRAQSLVLNLAEALIMRGAWDEAAAELDAAGQLADPIYFQCRHAEIATWTGDFERALPAFERRRLADAEIGAEHPVFRSWYMDYLDCLAGLGRRDEAVALARDLVDRSGHVAGRYALGTFQATLGRVSGDLDELRRAHEILEPSPFRWLAARASLDFGAALRRDGQQVQARDYLRATLEYADRQNVRHFAERARQELRLAGARPRRAALSGVDALTPAEDRIARLAAGGHSNKEIAQHLFLTVKTVEMNLVRAYRKLGIGSRRELPGALGQAA